MIFLKSLRTSWPMIIIFIFDLSFNLSAEEIGACQISSDVILQAFDHLKAGKKDYLFLDSTHFHLTAPVVVDSFSFHIMAFS